MQGETETWAGDIVHTSESESHASNVRQGGPRANLKVTIGNVDLPAFISNGQLYVQAPLPHVFEAFAEDLSAFLRDMEVRVSVEGGAPLPLDGDGRPVHGTTMAKPRMVRSGRKS